MHPLNLALGEARAAESLGVLIHEGSPVRSVDQVGGKAIVKTAQGQVMARFAVACGNAYLDRIVPSLSDKVMPVST